jgi:hypothetical protein
MMGCVVWAVSQMPAVMEQKSMSGPKKGSCTVLVMVSTKVLLTE